MGDRATTSWGEVIGGQGSAPCLIAVYCARGELMAINLLTTEAQHVDPVCGMTVTPSSAAGSFEHNGTTYYFCSEHCRKKFAADPEAFLSGGVELHEC